MPAVAYIVLATPWVQNRLKGVAETELTELLGTEVSIGRINYRPFNTITISSISIKDDSGRKALGIGRLSARFELFYFLRSKRLLFDYAVLDAPEINLWRTTPTAPLNIQPILDKFKKKDNQKPPASFDLKVGTIILRKGKISYNVESEPLTPGKFSPNHIVLYDFGLHGYLRHAANDDLDALIETMSFNEQSGFVLDDLIVDVQVGPSGTFLRDFEIALPASKISFKPIRLDAKSFAEIPEYIGKNGLNIATAEPATVSTSDLAAFSPVVGALDITAKTDFDIFISDKIANLEQFRLTSSDGININLTGYIKGLKKDEKRTYDLELQPVEAPGTALGKILKPFSHDLSVYLSRIAKLVVRGSVHGSGTKSDVDLAIDVDNGKINTVAAIDSPDYFKTARINGSIDVEDVMLGTILANKDLGAISAHIEGDAAINGSQTEAALNVNIGDVTWNKHIYKDIKIDGNYNHDVVDLAIVCNDHFADFDLEARINPTAQHKQLDADLKLRNFCPEELGIKSWRKGFDISGNVTASLKGKELNDVEGFIDLNHIKISDESGKINIREFRAEMVRDTQSDLFTIDSDFLNGKIEGEINPASLPVIFKDMASHIVPSLLDTDEGIHQYLETERLHNNFVADLTVDNMVDICRYLRLPITVIYPVDILASVNSQRGVATFSVDAPYLEQGDKIIDSTVAGAYINTADDRLSVYATTHMPTKKGPMALVLGITGADSRFDTKVDWEIERAIPLNGLIDFSTALSRSETGNICVDTHFNPGQINFGEDVWNIHPSTIDWCDNTVSVSDFRLTADNQEIRIDGSGSESPDDIIEIDLKDIHLISIFETLEIDNAMIGGTANGTFKASQILSKIPVLTTDGLHVDSISYNRCVIGTADVIAKWDNDKQSFFLDADILNPEGQVSQIKGDIFPSEERLDLIFDATHVRVGFMQPFMAAFASEVSGYGSGHAHLFGTFKNIDMEGDIFAEDLKVKIDFTNTVYSATDSVHIVPGIIELNDITIRDVNGNTATLNGKLTHEFFHLPRFDFQISQAHDFLCYDISEAMNPDWYGTIYGNGSASVVGWPGVIKIGAHMSTAHGSVFTFVLSDRLDAEQYSFITFNDVTELSAEEKFVEEDTPEAVKEYIERVSRGNDDKPSDYNLDFRVDITPDAQMILVMDPVGGDRIRAYGNGDLRMTYNSTENDLRMYGTYTLDRGSYNFTLQDIIIKDFTIDAGSSITFRGDPYSAQLNIEAAYQLNANLTDLDESFALDKDLNRTNVPVQALLKVSGDMRQPDLDFDLRFPTLTSDIYRKVRSIISTEDMMNRQIIYLLALNRFYTPDYMETTKGNELFSVASSTIASQLSSMLGKLSDKWSIAPNLRSDRGDFTDVEVDVALSSRLLNNRLLLNGNFGYRDKSLNTNQFIGDFDIEYLLTPKGNWRLKGYSRYNDQNYYVRTAPTTQGVGIMFRRDFDSLFPRKNRTKAEQADTVPTDSAGLK